MGTAIRDAIRQRLASAPKPRSTSSTSVAVRRAQLAASPDTILGHLDMTLKIGGRKKFKCRPGVVSSRMAIKIGERIEEVPDELLISKRSDDDF